MAAQIYFFKKNKIDLEFSGVSITVTDSVATNTGQDFVDFMRNRNNTSAWLTTGSTDAANTQLDIDIGVGKDLSEIILVKHNFKAFTIQYWNGSSYVDFSTPINESTHTQETSHFSFDKVEVQKVRIIITGTQVADADKVLRQLIFTENIGVGQLQGYPQIKKPMTSFNKRRNRMLSGKTNVVESVGYFRCKLSVVNWRIANDLDIVESIFTNRSGVLMWLSGGDEDQFFYKAIGYRKEDIYLVRPVNEYTPEFYKSLYTAGIKIDLDFEEAVS